MSEMWQEDFEQYRHKIIDDIDTLYVAADLRYLNNERQMVDWLYGESVEDFDDKVKRVVFANWASKRKILVEKPINGVDESQLRSIFQDEKGEIAFNIFFSDIFHRNLEMGSAFEEEKVECIQAEIYKDGRIAFLYFGKEREEVLGGDNTNDDFELEFDDDDDEEEPEVKFIMNGLELLGVECSEQGLAVHANLEKIIKDELGFDYWVDDFRDSLFGIMDGYAKQCSENEE